MKFIKNKVMDANIKKSRKCDACYGMGSEWTGSRFVDCLICQTKWVIKGIPVFRRGQNNDRYWSKDGWVKSSELAAIYWGTAFYHDFDFPIGTMGVEQVI